MMTKGVRKSQQHRRRLSESMKGRKLSKEHRRNLSKSHKGIGHSEETKEKMRIAHLGKTPSDQARIKSSITHGGDGDIHRLNARLHQNPERRYNADHCRWRKKIYERDNYTCRKCHKRGQLNAHHIKTRAGYPKLKYKLSNGITLCEDCHNEIKGKEWKWEWIFQAILN